ncbi:outer membrane beta-barrel protein [Glaciecola sp. 1036]|uniref:outer membrane beta-barrel protein n=1 Tax=Alteromonadaceae TaxID=72275 RepID=UPI003D04A260
MKNLPKKIILTSTLVACTTAYAQQFEDAASMEFGGFDFTPTVDLGLEYDDNVTQSNTDEIDSWSRTIAPQLNLFTTYGASDVEFSYRLVNRDYFSSDTDNFTDHFLRAATNLELNARNRIRASLNYEDGHDARGTNFSIGQGQTLSEPDQYKQSELDFEYSYGAFNADGRLDLNVNLLDKNYDSDSIIYQARDRKYSTLGGTFYYRVGANTDLTFDAYRTYVDYDIALDNANPLDSVQDSFLVGVDWEATAKTSGFAKIGYQTKDFDSAFREDFSGVDWALGVQWEPLEYSSIEVSTESNTNETNGEGNFIRGNVHSIEWRHDWLERVRSTVGFAYLNNRYEGQIVDGFDVRSDNDVRFNASVYYQFRRWLNFELTYRHNERDSNREQVEFDRNRLLLNAFITL